MTLEVRIENAKIWAESLRKVRGSVQCTYEDGNVKAVSTAEKTEIFVDGVLYG